MRNPTITVGFDATALLGARTGIGVFTDQVLTRLAQDPTFDITAFAVTWRGRDQLRDVVPAGVAVSSRPMAARPLRAMWQHTNVPTLRPWIGACDVVHGPNFVVPPAGGAAELATVHDLTPVRYPELCSADTLAYPGLVHRAIKRGAWLHAPSQFVAHEIVEHFAVAPDRVVAIPNGIDEPLPLGPTTDAARGRQVAGFERYILALGTIEPRKNLPFLVEAFAAIRAHDPDAALVIVGPDGWGNDELDAAILNSPDRDRIKRVGWVSATDRAALLRGAQVLAYPSRYEGFGLPPLEAMAVGTPAVVSDTGAIPEAVGEAALVVDNGAIDVDAFAEATLRVMHDDAFRSTLVAKGSARAGLFTWDATATALGELYHRIAAEHSSR